MYPLPPSLDGWENSNTIFHPSKDGGNGYIYQTIDLKTFNLIHSCFIEGLTPLSIFFATHNI
jgi:hypothetical protein